MARLVIHNDKIDDVNKLLEICPFGAIEVVSGKIEINASCKMCKLCVKNGPVDGITYEEDTLEQVINKSDWRGIAVYVEHVDGKIHPVTLELIGKANELAAKINHPVYALFIGNDLSKQCHELLHYNVDKVFVYDQKELIRFTIEAYTNVFEEFVNIVKPTAILIGATTIGRQLSPRVAARMRTGLTADCTILDMESNTDLIQIRPAFGGNIMAQISTPNHRPQMATVRYNVMNKPHRQSKEVGEIITCNIDEQKLKTNVEVIDIFQKAKETSIDSAEILVVAGRGIKKQEDLKMLEELAELLGGQLACTRPMIESGWIDSKRQVGLSGRTVRPKLIITCGVSGSIQFVAGMNKSECIIAINNDEKSTIFQSAHYCLVGDLYELVPTLIEMIKTSKGA